MNRRLYRSPDDRIFGGVAGGMAETYDLDPAVVRVGWALLILLSGGVFLLLYILMIFFVPLRPAGLAPWPMGASMPPPVGPDGQPMAPPPGPDSADPNLVAGSATQPPTPAYHYYRRHERRDGSAGLVFGVLLIAVGAFFLVREYIPAINFDLFWPLIVIAGGALLIVAASGRQRRPL